MTPTGSAPVAGHPEGLDRPVRSGPVRETAKRYPVTGPGEQGEAPVNTRLALVSPGNDRTSVTGDGSPLGDR
ncbi:hypothetical protein [Nocardia sp. CA-290969]|uniref:hypothetical protein n=1 Tax=Nocardia sp. CA-290969 TaxID=3239986 RepID=UPI003D8A8FEB